MNFKTLQKMFHQNTLGRWFPCLEYCFSFLTSFLLMAAFSFISLRILFSEYRLDSLIIFYIICIVTIYINSINLLSLNSPFFPDKQRNWHFLFPGMLNWIISSFLLLFFAFLVWDKMIFQC